MSADDRPAGSWYWHEVVGVTVTTSTGEDLGRVTDIFRTGGSEVFVVEGARGEILVPAVSSVIVDFAPASGRIVVDATALDLDDTEPRSRLRGRRTTRARRARERDSAVADPGDGGAVAPVDEIAATPGETDPGRHVTLHIDVITLFPGIFPGPLAESIPGRALASGAAVVVAHDLREWGLGRHRSVDDYPYGGGAGMLLRPEPVAEALDAVAPAGSGATRILLDPGGELFDQARAQQLATATHLVLICPRYEGIDDRVRSMIDLELSIGDYVLSGGESPALVVIDAVLRLLPGVIDAASPADESFSAGLLEYPQYTRPAEYRGMSVPDVLLSGHHGEVERWRRDQARSRTRRIRPDLLPPDLLPPD